VGADDSGLGDDIQQAFLTHLGHARASRQNTCEEGRGRRRCRDDQRAVSHALPEGARPGARDHRSDDAGSQPSAQSFPSSYSDSMVLWYFSLTALRLTLSVGVSSPLSTLRSLGRMANFLIRSTLLRWELTSSTPFWKI